ncbi:MULTISPECIES: SusD/RagB family nutrient-binding outer membrane lipoprotein [Olivibacter]|uniref:SusD/RagB family nutrient-binding outer membrane lipoprotein n=2 Tax=Olivibacter TaxID=376469 RepID=A0ABV6HJB6_9SPHI|nr:MULTISPECIES: SusD/RagB family nutrient-binding outer membrane lipoprotein [Olivibacter]MCL4642378.1 SusD/RagB family nutrient-binding outer membrane lipoprotein [Olivibacter sp. UJ_SKK_5.1]MDX3913326.1 SusD/RagB family nutrient-binding outer membrane lipoprotein [Pseudosphingobacterium sp.]QEL01771.1 SusD/RagB family nutrient-binding outer membrane lipoprotein [Olivibacter sp. LS-1]
MKKYFIIGLCTATLSISSCKKSSFDEFYRDPSKVTETTVDKQFAGMIYGYRQLIVPDYRNYFVTILPTIARYIQIDGWANEANQLTPGAAAIDDRWSRYYEGLAQFRELETTYNNSDPLIQGETRIFYLTAKILFYDQTQQIVDLHGDIPWSQAGKLSSNGGDYSISYAPYDTAIDIYTAMLDDLATIEEELNSLTVPSTSNFSSQDLVNNGDVELWKKYCNSLRLRMLTRVSASSQFSSRAQSEIAEIANDLSSLILTNADNAQLDVFDASTGINATGFQDALESWNGNIAGKVMIDHMLANLDPRLPFIFEPGAEADGRYIGLDQSLTGSVQSNLITGPAASGGGTIAIYNRSTFSRNDYFPGMLISASEVNFLLAEYFLKAGNMASAKTFFENGIKESIALFQQIRAVSNDILVPAAAAPTATQINTYINNVNWDGNTNKIELIAYQKWLHFNMMQPVENWAEVRRLDYPTFLFRVQNSDIQKTVPVKFNLPSSEQVYNSTNYQAVAGQDNVNTKLFWDVN